MRGNDSINIIKTGDGDDVIRASGADVHDGGAGADTMDFSSIGGAVGRIRHVERRPGDDNREWQQTGSARNIENLIGTAGDDVLIGDGLGNIIDGGERRATIGGRGGNDTLIGSAAMTL